jgi:hypothetical protein
MTSDQWTVNIIGQAKKSDKTLSKGSAASFSLLFLELRSLGPYRSNWPNYTKMKGSDDDYHCHIEKGRPTYVACWRVINKKQKIIEVYYAGTHEKAPY